VCARQDLLLVLELHVCACESCQDGGKYGKWKCDARLRDQWDRNGSECGLMMNMESWKTCGKVEMQRRNAEMKGKCTAQGRMGECG